MNIIVQDLIANRVEFEDFIEEVFGAGYLLDLETINFNNLTLRKDKPIDFPERIDEMFKPVMGQGNEDNIFND